MVNLKTMKCCSLFVSTDKLREGGYCSLHLSGCRLHFAVVDVYLQVHPWLLWKGLR